MRNLAGIATALFTLVAAGQEFTAQFPIEELHFSLFGSTPYFSLNPGHRLVLEGEEGGQPITLTVTALNETKTVTLSSGSRPRAIVTRVIEERELVNGALNEVGRFWYARAIETGDIYLFGEETDFYFNGEIVGQTLLWEAGVDGALPGIVMPRTFLLGARYHQNQAIGALDGAENLAMGITMTTPAGSFSNCVQIQETDLLRPELGGSLKTYAPGVGLINDDDVLRLAGFRLGVLGLPRGCSFVPFSHHSLLPFAPGHQFVLGGNSDGTNVARTIAVLDEVRNVALSVGGELLNIPTRVIEERTTANGEVVEVTRIFLSQCVETGDVHLFGREVDHYASGTVTGHEGSWLAGVNGAEAGLFLPATFAVGARYTRENAPGVASQLASNSASGLNFITTAGTFTNCSRVTITSSLAPNASPREFTYAPGIGLIGAGDTIKLISYSHPNTTNGSPVLAIQNAVVLSWPFTDDSFWLESSSNLVDWSPIQQIPSRTDGWNQIAVPRDRTQNHFRLVAP